MEVGQQVGHDRELEAGRDDEVGRRRAGRKLAPVLLGHPLERAHDRRADRDDRPPLPSRRLDARRRLCPDLDALGADPMVTDVGDVHRQKGPGSHVQVQRDPIEGIEGGRLEVQPGRRRRDRARRIGVDGLIAVDVVWGRPVLAPHVGRQW